MTSMDTQNNAAATEQPPVILTETAAREIKTIIEQQELDAETAALGRIQARRYGYAVVEDNEDDQGLIPRCHFDAGGRWTCRLVPAKNWRSER